MKKAKILRDPRSLARFLCGVTSPGITRARLSRHALFGALEHIPFKQVEDWVGQQNFILICRLLVARKLPFLVLVSRGVICVTEKRTVLTGSLRWQDYMIETEGCAERFLAQGYGFW